MARLQEGGFAISLDLRDEIVFGVIEPLYQRLLQPLPDWDGSVVLERGRERSMREIEPYVGWRRLLLSEADEYAQ